MGQKVNPTSLRLVLNKSWSSKWFNQDIFGELLAEDSALRNAINSSLARTGGIEKIEILRNAQEISISIIASKPGVIIGRSGSGINDLSKKLEKVLNNYRASLPYYSKSRVEKKNLPKKIKINIVEVSVPELSATVVAQNIAIQLEKRIAYRKAVHQAMGHAMDKGAKGVKIGVAGRLNGAEIARKEKFAQGTIPLSTLRADIDYAHTNAFTTFGTIGVKVWIYKGMKKQAIKDPVNIKK